MIIVSYGVRKSGSTLAFELTRAVLEENGYAQPSFTTDVRGRNNFNVVNDWTADRFERMIEFTVKAKIVIKTHATPRRLAPSRVLELIAAGDLAIQVVYRDPRDTALSLLDEARAKTHKPGPNTIDEALERIRGHGQNLRRWGAFPSLKLCYDDFAFDRLLGPKLIADQLGLVADPEEVWERVNRRSTRKNVARPHRWHTEMSSEDAAAVAASLPEYLRLVEQGDLSFFDS